MDKIPDLKKDLQPGTGANVGPVGYGVGVFIAAKTKKKNNLKFTQNNNTQNKLKYEYANTKTLQFWNCGLVPFRFIFQLISSFSLLNFLNLIYWFLQ